MLLIIMNIRDENDRAFVEEMYDIYSHRLYQYAYEILKDNDASEECVNDVFVRIIEHLDQFRSTDEIDRIKLMTIYAKNYARTKYAYRKKDHINTVSLYVDEDEDEDESGVLAISDDKYNPENIVIRETTSDLLMEAVDSLEDKYFEVIMLKYGYNFSTVEIAKKLNITESTVRSRIQRAREKMLEWGGEDLYE